MNEQSVKYELLLNKEYNLRGMFLGKCRCGKMHTIFTQADNDPEYYTVFILCDCDNLFKFSLPVN